MSHKSSKSLFDLRTHKSNQTKQQTIRTNSHMRQIQCDRQTDPRIHLEFHCLTEPRTPTSKLQCVSLFTATCSLPASSQTSHNRTTRYIELHRNAAFTERQSRPLTRPNKDAPSIIPRAKPRINCRRPEDWSYINAGRRGRRYEIIVSGRAINAGPVIGAAR